MTAYPQTFDGFAKMAPDTLFAEVINALAANNEFLRYVPMERWPGGESYSWMLNSTLPTISNVDETSTIEGTRAVRKRLTTYLSQYAGQVEIPTFIQGTMANRFSAEAEDVMDLVRAMGQKIRAELIQGNWMTEASDCTVAAEWQGASNGGIDAVTAISANMPKGAGALFYDHSATSLYFRAPGSSTYGAAVDISGGDATYTCYDGDDTTMHVSLTIDVSDLAADKRDAAALTFLRPDEVAGLKELAALDSNQVVTPSTNGDAITLAALDQLEEMVVGPKEEKCFLMNARTRRAVKALLMAAGGARPAEWMGMDVSKYALQYEGVPIFASPSVVINETQGSATTCGRVYCVRLNPSRGLHLFYGEQVGPNEGTMAAISDDDPVGGAISLPVYLRRLPEQDTKAVFSWRISAALAVVLRQSNACAMRYGITS